jgi:hypothetical protein
MSDALQGRQDLMHLALDILLALQSSLKLGHALLPEVKLLNG